MLVSGPSNASSFTLDSDGSFRYTPDADFNGSDSFTYKARDASGAESGTATVAITVNAVNDDPDAVNDTTTTNEDTEKVVDALANDSFAPDTCETLSVQSVADATNGTVSKITSGPDAGKVLYMPDTDYYGTDSFTYTVSDGNGGTDTATVNVTVSAVNDAPTISVLAGNASQSVCLSDTRGRITLKLSDVDNDVSTFAPTASFPSTPKLVRNVTFADNGESRTATISTFSGRTGDSTVTFSVSDGKATSSVTVTVKVRGNGNDTLNGTGWAGKARDIVRAWKLPGWRMILFISPLATWRRGP